MKHVSKRQLILLLAIAFALRLAAGWGWQSRLDGQFGMGDSDSYWRLGLTIAKGQPYELGENHARVFRAPGYPILLAPVFWIAGEGPAAVMLARAEAALFGTLAVLGVWWLARLLFDDRAAMLAAALATIYPGAISLSVWILSEAPFCPLMLLQLVLWILAWQSSSPGRRAVFGIGAGLAGGAATLMRPSWLLFTPMAVAVEMWMQTRGRRRGSSRAIPTTEGETTRLAAADHRFAAVPAAASSGIRAVVPTAAKLGPDIDCPIFNKRHDFALAFWILLGLVTAMTPWWIRNACVTGRFVATTLQTGASLYDGLNPEANGSSNMEFVSRFEAEERRRAGGQGDQGGDKGDSPIFAETKIGTVPAETKIGTVPEGTESLELRLDRRMRDESLAWTWANPGRAVQLAEIKFLRMWNGWPNEPRFSSWPLLLAVFFTYTPVLIFAIIGAWRTFGRGWPYILCWLPAVYLTMLHMVFVSSIRYREPAMLALLALAAGGFLGARGLGLGARDLGLVIRKPPVASH